jgi:hypothetical protein
MPFSVRSCWRWEQSFCGRRLENTGCAVSNMKWEYGSVRNRFLMTRRLEDRIRSLCAQAVATEDSAELREILKSLRSAIHEHTQRLRKAAVDPQVKQRRRSA